MRKCLNKGLGVEIWGRCAQLGDTPHWDAPALAFLIGVRLHGEVSACLNPDLSAPNKSEDGETEIPSAWWGFSSCGWADIGPSSYVLLSAQAITATNNCALLVT